MKKTGLLILMAVVVMAALLFCSCQDGSVRGAVNEVSDTVVQVAESEEVKKVAEQVFDFLWELAKQIVRFFADLVKSLVTPA